MRLSEQRDAVRELARQVAAVAADPENERRKRRWRDVNALRRPDRAPIWCKPVGAWNELLPDAALVCEDRRLRGVERRLRQILIKHDIGDDEPVNETFDVEAAFDCDPPNVWGLDVRRERPDAEGGAWRYDPPLKTPEDFDRLRLPTFTYNAARTEEALSYAHDLLGDVLPVRRVCGPKLHCILCMYAGELRGLTEVMMDAVAAPDLLHRLMAHLRDAVLQADRQVEASGLLTREPDAPMTCSDPFGPEAPDGRITLKNLWCMTNSQEFDPVSPTMWEEFLLEYQKPIMAQFGRVGYGCCENLTHKIEGVLSIPNLRIFVCSAWTDLDVVLDRVPPERCVIMWRQKASDVVFPDDVNTIRRGLEDGLRRLRGRPYQIVLRELQTLAGHPDRLHVWTALARELAAKYA